MRIAIVIGTRPEAIKLLPVYLECVNHPAIEPMLISTGQHKDMLNQIFDFFQVSPNISLDVMEQAKDLSSLTGAIFNSLGKIVKRSSIDVLVVQGDTTTAMAAAMIGFYENIKVAHVEAGLRTHNRFSPFPEEVNRKIISLVADYNFTPTDTAKNNLKAEGATNIFNVGNTVIDSLYNCMKVINEKKDYYEKKFKELLIPGKDLILVTSHRRENFGSRFKEICNALSSLAKKYHESTTWVYPVHLNPNIRNHAFSSLSNIPNLFLEDPLPYDELIFLLSHSKLVLTDSGGIQEEAPSLNVPILIMRDTTERPEGVQAGCALLVGTSLESIIINFEELINDSEKYERMAGIANPYGDGEASKRIIEVLLERKNA